MPSAKLVFGPYKTPTFRYGATVTCGIRGDVQIVGLSDGRIPWPLGKVRGTRAKPTLIVYCGLEKAIRRKPLGVRFERRYRKDPTERAD